MTIHSDRRDLLKHEVSIIWEEDPRRLDYVREKLDMYPNRRRIRKWRGGGRRVGYSVVGPGAPNERGFWGGWMGFYRREFFLEEHDRACDPAGVYETGCPVEGVDPLTVRPGVAGVQNDRAWGAPTGRPAA